MKTTLLLFAFLLCSFSINAQLDKAKFDAFILELDSLREAEQTDEAVQLIDKNLSSKKQNGESLTPNQLIFIEAYKTELLAKQNTSKGFELSLEKAINSKEIQQHYPRYLPRFRNVLAYLFLLKQDYQKGYEIAQQAKKDWEITTKDTLLYIEIQRQVVFGLNMLGKTSEAKAILEECLTLIEKQQLEGSNQYPLVLRSLGENLMRSGDYQTAIQHFEKARQLLSQKNKANTSNLTGILVSLGNANLYSGDFAQALQYFRAYTANLIELKQENQRLAGGYFSIGLAYYYLNQLEKAKVNLEKALTVCIQIGNEKSPLVAAIYDMLGNVLVKQEAFGEAINFLKESIAKTLEKSAYNKRELAFKYNNLGAGYLENQQPELALKQFKIAENLIAENEGQNHPLSTISLTYQCWAYLALDEPQRALELSNQILGILRYSEEMDFANYPYPNYLLWGLYARAKTYRHLFQQSGSSTDLVAANTDFLQAIAVMDALRKGYQGASQLTLLKKHYEVVEGTIATFFDLNQIYPDSNYVLQALEIAENAKARLLQEEQLDRLAKFKATVPDSLLQIEQNLKTEIVQLQQTAFLIEQQNLSDSLLKIQNQIFGLENQLKEWKNNIQKNYPDYQYYTESQQKKTLDFDIILEEYQAAIEFFVGNDALYVFTIQDKDKMNWQKLENEEWTVLRQQIKDWQTQVTKRKMELSTAVNTALTATFVPFINSDIKQLLIIPDDILGLFPYEILEADGEMLIEKYAIHYDYSLSLQQENRKPRASIAPKFLAAYAPQYEKNQIAQIDTFDNQLLSHVVRSGNYHLPGAQREAVQIAALFGADAYLGLQATEEHFVQTAADYRILHLAMHALVEPSDIKFSRLLFSNPLEDSLNDNRLTAAELMNMNLNANLAVLSACNTGSGEIQIGEGIMSLARAFAYAGVPATVTSLWKAPDQQTADIMLLFYENLKAGEDKAIALQNAKLSFLENATATEFHHPYYWAGFVLTGDAGAVSFEGKISFWWWGLGVFFLGIILLFLKKIKKN